MLVISPSVLAANFARLGEDVKRVEDAGADWLHLDVMDGIFVPNISFGAPVIAALRGDSKLVFDVHLMITEPQRYIDDFVKAGADIITIHYESCKDPEAVVDYIKSKGVRAAVAIKPATEAKVLYPMMKKLDMALVMTVEPGFGGQKLIPETVSKVRELREYADANGLNTDIQVDGGVTEDNIGMLAEAGANVIVAGSAVFKAADTASAINKIKSAG